MCASGWPQFVCTASLVDYPSFTPGPTLLEIMSSRSSSPTPSSADSISSNSSVTVYIDDDCVDEEKLHLRLCRVYGIPQVEYHWHRNQYIVPDMPRDLNKVSPAAVLLHDRNANSVTARTRLSLLVSTEQESIQHKRPPFTLFFLRRRVELFRVDLMWNKIGLLEDIKCAQEIRSALM